MQLVTKGDSFNILDTIVGRVTRNIYSTNENSIFIVENDLSIVNDFKGLALLSTLKNPNILQSVSSIYNIPNLNHLLEGDIVSISIDGVINTLYRSSSPHNTLFVTERCNSNCLMCSQPPKNKNDIEYLYSINQKLIELIPTTCEEIGISGGEPTLLGNLFFKMLSKIKEKLPNTEVHILSNGRSFAWKVMAKTLSEINNNKITIGIPIYSDFYQLHDYIVQSRNAFYQTILGLYNLAKYNQRIEIRIVLHKLTIPRLKNIAQYIFKNLPFVEHIAFMGLEHIGYAKKNFEKVWIDPADYIKELSESVNYLYIQGMNVSIYNSQLCVLPESLWKFARKSISDWKNEYLPECNNCSKKDQCGGFFKWNLINPSRNIKSL